jgi:hypothetical protein
MRIPVMLDLINRLGSENVLLAVEREVDGPSPNEETPAANRSMSSSAAGSEAAASVVSVPVGGTSKRLRLAGASSAVGSGGDTENAGPAIQPRGRRAPKQKKHLEYVAWAKDSTPAVQVKRHGPVSLPGFQCLPFSDWPESSFRSDVSRWHKFLQKTPT